MEKLDRLEREVPGQGILSSSSLADRLRRRESEVRPRTACGEAVAPPVLKLRRGPVLSELPAPAPLLMRMMRFKTQLERGARSYVPARPQRVRIEARIPAAVEIARASSELHGIIRGNPLRTVVGRRWLDPAQAGGGLPRGMRAARGFGEEG